jgi:ABC-2 type transport system ATP-binding protein
MIQADLLTKTYGNTTAVDSVSFTVQAGKVTGFLGPNGAGKSTTMRMIVGLDAPSSGTVTVNGRSYDAFPSPMTEVGALLDAKAMHPGRTARDHLRSLAATHRIGKSRIESVLDLTGLSAVAGKRVGGFSLGMGQRLGIAAALLGDPGTLILDEPVNGLDPEGVLWVRHLARSLASEGRTVLLSSHLMSEMAQTADHLIVLGRGRVIADAPVDTIVNAASGAVTRVTAPRIDDLARALISPDVTMTRIDANTLQIAGRRSSDVGELAARLGIPLHELTPVHASLEDAYLALTHDEVEYRSEVSA